MLDNVKKIGIIIIIAILFTVFSFSIVDLVLPEPEYENFCGHKAMPIRPVQKDIECMAFEVPEQDIDDCNNRKGFIDYSYDANGCPVDYTCNTCNAAYDAAGKEHRFVGFIITTIMGIIAIIVGLYACAKQEVVEWIYAGFLIGGIASIAFGTMSYFRDMGRFAKPIVLLIEMALIIWIAVRTASRNAGIKKKKK